MIVGMVGTHADDLAPLKDEIVNIIDDSQPYDTKAWQDKALYRKKLDGVPTKELPGSDPYTPEQILAQLHEGYGLIWDQFSPITPPSWLAGEEKLHANQRASLVFTFDSFEKAQQFQDAKAFYIFGSMATVSNYKDRPHPVHCEKCASLHHRSHQCKSTYQCHICGDEDHSTFDHPNDCQPKCINCNGEHPSMSRNCRIYCKRAQTSPCQPGKKIPQTADNETMMRDNP